MTLKKSTLANLELFKAGWRPFLGYASGLCVLVIVFTVCFSVLMDGDRLAGAISFFVAAIPALAVFGGVQSLGRSWEKTKDAAAFDAHAHNDLQPDADLEPFTPPPSFNPPPINDERAG